MGLAQNHQRTPDAVADVVVLAANSDVRRIARFLLESSGVTATITDDGRTAANAMCRGVPQLLIADREVLRRPDAVKLSKLKQQHGALRIAVVEDAFSAELMPPAGIDLLLSWPLIRHDLLDCLPEQSAYWKLRRQRHA
jgi:hypothetical protein